VNLKQSVAAGSKMAPEPNTTKTHSLFRWLAGVTCPFFVFAAIVTAFPQIVGGNGQPSFLLAALLLWGGALFGSIAATGKLKQ
jgi:hypothetical protein